MFNRQSLAMISSSIFLILTGFLFGFWLYSPKERIVETARMEQCLKFYQEYRVDQDQKKLATNLKKLGLTPMDFQKIIDRFIYYRSRKSQMGQAMKLLKAFRLGYDIKPVKVVSISNMASEPFRLDAEILAVFEERPELVKKAFEG